MNSGVGRNVQFYCERFGMRIHDLVPLARERKMVVDDDEMVRRASMVKDLVMVRVGVCCLSSDEFSIDDVYALISHLYVCM